MEYWLPIPDSGGHYEASSLGRVRSLDRTLPWGHTVRRQPGRVLKPGRDRNGYLCLCICHDGLRQTSNVHRLVARAFHGEALGREVNHKDGDKTNNRPENLEWCSRAQNVRHSIETGLLPLYKPVFATPVCGGAPIRFPSINAALAFVGGRKKSHIIDAAKGRRSVSYGYHWQYEYAA